MNIGIIGGGWVGCHLANKLKDTHNITIFEKNDKLFQETSYNNQNRLHFGFHYSRNYETRELCRNTYNKFINDYGFCVGDVDKNCYCVPNETSIIDFKTYLKIFNDFDYDNIELKLDNVEGCINTNEKYINFKLCSDYFNNELKELVVTEEITLDKLNDLSNKFDLIIDSTNNQLNNLSGKNFYELTICLIYEKIKETEFDSLTMVEGDLFSIYPYYDNLYTLTDVEHTPIKKFNNIKSLVNYTKNFDDSIIQEKIKVFEKKVLNYYPEFKENFKYNSYFLSTKSKIINLSSRRYPIIIKNNNVINCFTGKIQGIYVIEDYIKNLLNGKN